MVLRILDVNANRAREALRVMEETARFILDDADLTNAIKTLRHDLATIFASIPNLSANRNIEDDVGKTLTTKREGRRDSIADVVTSACKRLSEALRVIEEYGKILNIEGAPTEFSRKIESTRYRGYELEKRLDRALSGCRSTQWRLCVLLTESLCAWHHWQYVLDAALDAGADCIQLREKEIDTSELLLRADITVARCRRYGASAIINDRPDVAQLAGADGVHLGQTDLPCFGVRKLFGHQLLIGVSTSTLTQAATALRNGADYCGVGPMFSTTTKSMGKIAGPVYFKSFITRFSVMPHLAIGGINPDNVAKLIHAGAKGVAVSSSICAAANPANVAKRFLRLLDD